jgi:hypothetical protein
MIEYRLFGGVIEYEEQKLVHEKIAFSVERIIRYPFSGANPGSRVSWDENAFFFLR